MVGLWDFDGIELDSDSYIPKIIQHRFMASLSGEVITAEKHILLKDTSHLRVADEVAKILGNVRISGENDKSYIVQGKFKEHPALVLITQGSRSRHAPAAYEHDDEEVATGIRINRVKIELIGHRVAIRGIVTHLTTTFNEAKVSSIRWWFQGDHGPGNREMFLEPLTTKLCPEFYPGLGEPLQYLDNYLKSEASILMMAGPAGTGKCLAPDEPVMLYNGNFKLTKDLIIGDLLMGPDSKPRKILATNKGFGPMFEVRPVKGKAWKCNGDHLLSLRKSANPNKDKVIFVSVDEWLTWTNAHKGRWKLWRASVDFEPIDPSPVDPYLVGICLGDGSLSKGLSVSNPDKEIIDYLHSMANIWNVKLVNTVNDDDKCPIWNFYGNGRGPGCNPLLTAFQRMRLYRLKCEDKFIPDEIKFGSREVRLQCLAGILDTDGSLNTNGYDFASKSERLASDVTFIARSLGLAAYCHPMEATCQTGATGTYWQLFISGHAEIIPCKVVRKQAAPRQQIKDVTNTGFEIEPLGDGDWFGIEIDGDGQYLLDDFTVTHNTTLLRHLICDFNLAADIIYDQSIMTKDSVFQDFLFSKSQILIIEDADRILLPREDDNHLMARFLSVSDGIIKLPEKKMVFTTNLGDFGKVDHALTRPGRCFDIIHTRELDYTEACTAAKAAGIDQPTTEKHYTLAELFNKKPNYAQRKPGFR